MNTSRAIAMRILELCEERNYTVNYLSTLSAVRQSTVNGTTKNAGIITLKKLCDGLEISLTDFFDCDLFRHLEQEIK